MRDMGGRPELALRISSNTYSWLQMIIVPENLISDEDENLLLAKVSKVFDGDGFLFGLLS
jgi:hypothetical protein